MLSKILQILPNIKFTSKLNKYFRYFLSTNILSNLSIMLRQTKKIKLTKNLLYYRYNYYTTFLLTGLVIFILLGDILSEDCFSFFLLLEIRVASVFELFVLCLFDCLFSVGKYSHFSPHPPLFPSFILLSPLLLIGPLPRRSTGDQSGLSV